ncbi:RNA polymerase sigma factor [Spirosoma endbachense]|uniref:Sigma-70 family RNA polymerase sigma factor n=1 Tax=Spirosoma endbachense TaxID=2666025 RepID=A0A6P1VRZ4_9BACT|nr:sigma-70 family RNA polymerase sigma factor [Spirosoma endbachense]QHV95188.1 sigma-70 family RNA polymerase sigma factor [Spirosoma endbachense]
MKKPPTIPEDELVEALKARSQKAYSVLYDRYAPTLLAIICKVVKDNDEAENVLQDTFVKIWRHIDSYDAGKGRLFTWILNIARNTGINFLRSQRNSDHTDIQTLADSVHTDRNAISDAINVNHIGVSDTVARLDPKLRQMIDLIYFEGYTQQEVADHLKMPLGTVKTRTRMALQQLKDLFDR